ncbi:MAG: hypothetical protein ABI591_20965 [Kofleriaceae bacterium]
MTLALTVALAACGGKKDEPKPTPPPVGSAATGSGSAAMTGSGSAGSAAPAAAVDVPTEMDFEQQAKTDITDKNVDTEVKKIEADLGSGN